MKTQTTPTGSRFSSFLKHAETAIEFLQREDVQASLKKIPGIIKGLRTQPQVADIVTYTEVVEYFIKSRPNSDQIVKGALMTEEHSSGKRLTFLFLDANNEPVLHNGKSPYGKTVITNAIDEALVDFSEGRSVIVFE